MLKKNVIIVFLVSLSLQAVAGDYNCFRCITAPVNRTETVKEITTCDLDRVYDLQHSERYQCVRLSS